MKTELWEILVPASNNKDQKFTYEHHKEWDSFVKKTTGGVTIMKTAKGEWVSPTGKLYVDRTIPCRIVCTEEQISEIIDFTIEYYNQEAVLAYRISTNVILRHKNKKEIPELPKPPISRIIREGATRICVKCYSSVVRQRALRWRFGCINPECEDYGKVKKDRLKGLV